MCKLDVLLTIDNCFSNFISDFRSISKQILEVFFPLLKFFLLTASFYFGSRGAFPVANFIYHVPCKLH